MILEGELEPASGRLVATPDVIAKSSIVPRKFRDDIAILSQIFGEKFTTGLCIAYSLQEILEILPRERKRIDSYASLTKYLETKGITLTIKSNKTK